MTRQPPVPPANRSPKGPQQDIAEQEETPKQRPEQQNLKEQGQQGNTYQNTRNQGYQQDR